MKLFTSTLLLFGIVCFIACSSNVNPTPVSQNETVQPPISGLDSTRLKIELPNQIKNLKSFIKSNPGKYSDKTAILIDMRIPSKYNRFFVVDLKNETVLERTLVAHGSGSETSVPDSLQFSNTPNSYMTSLGTYKIGASYTGSFGKSYKLHGLDKTNSKAFDRLVVLHRYSCVPEDGEQYENICTSLGCPMVSEAFFPVVDKYITAAGKPVLLKIYY